MACRYVGPPQVLIEVFKSIDSDGGGAIGFDELYEFVKGRRHALDARTRGMLELRLVMPEGVTSLEELKWDGADGVWALRLLLMDMLLRSKAGPSDLLKAWKRTDRTDRTRSTSRGLTRSVFLSSVHKLFNELKREPELWDIEVRDAADAAFTEMISMVTGQNFMMSIGVLHLERWLTLKIDEALRSSRKVISRYEIARRTVYWCVRPDTPKHVQVVLAASGTERKTCVCSDHSHRRLQEIPRKSAVEFAAARRRRREERRSKELQAAKPHVNVDWVEKARTQIAQYVHVPPDRAIAPPGARAPHISHAFSRLLTPSHAFSRLSPISHAFSRHHATRSPPALCSYA